MEDLGQEILIITIRYTMKKKAHTPDVKMDRKICAEGVVDFLVDKKITKVFDLSGGMIAFMEDAISRREGIECLPMHHEQAAGFAAEGYARSSQNFGVAMATSGPGATNLITAIGSSYFDSIATMFIVGQVHTENIKKHDYIRQEGFQETDIVKVIAPLTKYAVRVSEPERFLYELEKAHFIMKSGRPGSVLIDIPINFQRTEVDMAGIPRFIGSAEHRRMVQASRSERQKPKGGDRIAAKVRKLENLLRTSKAPIVLVGNGVRISNTSDQLASFIKKNNLPVITSLLGIDSYPQDELLVGFIGSNGNRDANIAFANADLIIALGTRLDIRQTGDAKFFNKQATVVHVDIDRHSLNYLIKSPLTFEMDLNDFFEETKNLTTPKKSAWFSFLRDIRKEFGRSLSYGDKDIDPNAFINELSMATSDQAQVLVDVGQNQMWAAQSWGVKKGQRLMFSGGMGAMGFSLPASVGAWCAHPERETIVICGDGGLQINIQELETVSRNRMPLRLFIMNNNSLGMVREFQDLYFSGNHQSTVKGYGCPNLEKLANAYGFEYVRIDALDKERSQQTLKNIMSSKNPVLIEVTININAPLHPKVVYGHALDDQAPYLDDSQKAKLEALKTALRNS
jgi:acetolactate synthase-1/2/3 large subunit